MSMAKPVKILIIDDERTFEQVEMGTSLFDKVVYARTLDEAYHEIMGEGKRWDVVYLDHDLGNGQNTYTLCEAIEQAAIENEELLPITKFVIHSMNPVGRQRMYVALHKMYNVEFARVEDLI